MKMMLSMAETKNTEGVKAAGVGVFRVKELVLARKGEV
jgi:hypothetical protein